MSKILMAKSSESAGSLHQLGFEGPFKKTIQFKSEYELKKLEKDSEKSLEPGSEHFD